MRKGKGASERERQGTSTGLFVYGPASYATHCPTPGFENPLLTAYTKSCLPVHSFTAFVIDEVSRTQPECCVLYSLEYHSHMSTENDGQNRPILSSTQALL